MDKKLQEIIPKSKEDLLRRKKLLSLTDLKTSIEGKTISPFIKSIKHPKKGSIAIIAEIKLSSPTAKNLGKSQDIEDRVKKYELANVDAISIITEKKIFKGDPQFIKRAKKIISLPILQKDFIIDSYQIYEAKKIEADAILLIAKIVSQKDLINLVTQAQDIGIEPVVEINSVEDLKKATSTNTKIIAVNARDLNTFEVNINKACSLLKKISDIYIKLGFSGVSSKVAVRRYQQAGADAILIGTSLMKTNNIIEFIEGIRV